MPDVLAWKAEEAEQILQICGFAMVRIETFPLRPFEGEKSWRVVRQKLLTNDQVEVVVALDIGFSLAKTYI
jgi:hypothetical protein